MKHSLIQNTFLIPFLAFFTVLSLTPTVDAVDTGRPAPPGKPTLDCGDSSNQICVECCPSTGCPDLNKIACCQRDCDIINPPKPAAFPDIHLELSAGGAQLVFDRTQRIEGNSGREFFEITLQQLFDSTVSRQIVKVKTQLTGADAAVGSMLYAVAFLGTGANALDVLHEHGYDVSIIGGAPSETCQARFPATTCTALANQLSQSIAASLPIGDAAERDAFLLGVQALGFAPCQFIP